MDLSSEVLSHGGCGLGSISCVQEDIDIRMEGVIHWVRCSSVRRSPSLGRSPSANQRSFKKQHLFQTKVIFHTILSCLAVLSCCMLREWLQAYCCMGNK